MKNGIDRREIFSIPNLMGYFRILLIPLFSWMYCTADSTGDYYAAAVVVGISGLTDMFDGKIARRFNMITELGKFIDPLADKLIVLKGNCDSDVDTLISDFEFVSEAVLYAEGKKIFLQHGDKYCIDNLPKNCGDCFIYGHYHTGFIKREGAVLVANCGSVSLPKGGTPNSYLLLEEGVLVLKELDGKELCRMNI